MQRRKDLEEFLLQCIEKYDTNLKFVINDLENANFETIEKLQDIVSDELNKDGFEQKYEPSAYGLKLEDLIDYLGNFYPEDDGQ